MKDDKLTIKEIKLEKEFETNYLICMATLVANNIHSIYKYYRNDYEFSLNSIIKSSKDTFKLNDKLLKKIIKERLQSLYDYKLSSKDNENLKLKEL